MLPVLIAGTDSTRDSFPNLMMAPFPNCFSIWETAIWMAFSLSLLAGDIRPIPPLPQLPPGVSGWELVFAFPSLTLPYGYDTMFAVPQLH